MAEIVFKDESYQIMGACFEVYKEMGCGFLERVYQECLERELTRFMITSFSDSKEFGEKNSRFNMRQKASILPFFCGL